MQAIERHRRDRYPSVRAAIGAACSVLLVASCSATVLDGRAKSMLYDPNRVGGLPAEDGPSGPRDNAPKPTGTVRNTDDGEIDRLALLAINDVEDFWNQNYSQSLEGTFTPVSDLLSYDADDPSSPTACGGDTYQLVNAFYCPPEDLMAWDRGTLVPVAEQYFGPMSVNALMAHEYGHAVQHMAELVDSSTHQIVAEQQADCFSGAYSRWVAEGKSERFTLSTTDGLDHVLAAAIQIRDPVLTADTSELIEEGHGTALDRVSAFQIGFDVGPAGCAEIDMDEIEERRADLPLMLQEDQQSGDVPIDEEVVSTLTEQLGEIFSPANPPTLTMESTNCSDAQPSEPASYCPASNTISVDMPALEELGTPADESQLKLVQGDNTAISVVTSRYMLALQHERELKLDTPEAALRTACLTGVAQREMAEPGGKLQIAAGDLDEAVAGLLTNGLVASDTNGKPAPAGFTRILAFRSGLLGDADQCYQRFP